MKCLLDMPVSSEKHYAVLERFGFEPDEINNRTLLATSLFVNAVEKGNVAAFQEIKDLDMSVEEKNESIPFILPATVIAAPFLSVYRDVIQLKLGTNIFAYKKRITEVNIGYENNIETIEPVFGDDEKEIIQEV